MSMQTMKVYLILGNHSIKLRKMGTKLFINKISTKVRESILIATVIQRIGTLQKITLQDNI